MYIHGVRKFLDAGGIKPEEIMEHDPLFCWYVNIGKVNRKNFMVAINEKTGYPLFFYGMKKKDIQNFGFHLELAIEAAFKREGYPLEYIFHYLHSSSTDTFHKTNSRKTLGFLKEVTYYASFQEKWYIIEGCFHISTLSVLVSQTILGVTSKQAIFPREEMLTQIQQLYNTKNIEVS
jgi:hypothetical protein